MIPETTFQNALEKALNAPRRDTRVARINSGDAIITNADGSRRRFRGAKKGTGDLVGWVRGDGWHLEIEAKSSKEKPRKAQLRRAAALERDGAIHVFVRVLDDEDLEHSVELALEQIDAAIEARRFSR